MWGKNPVTLHQSSIVHCNMFRLSRSVIVRYRSHTQNEPCIRHLLYVLDLYVVFGHIISTLLQHYLLCGPEEKPQNINNVSVNNTTIYFIYNKNSILSGRHVSTFTVSSSGPLRNRSKNYLYFHEFWIPQCIEL